jgi:hypothetical protein
MAKKLYEESSVKAIANAIRRKNGSTDTYKIGDMAAAIDAISGGGSPTGPYIEYTSLDSSGKVFTAKFRGTIVPEHAFSYLAELTSVDMPDNVIAIGDNGFYRCPKLQLASLPPRITSLGDFAFSDCSKLGLTSLPSGITSIGEQAFANCSSLETVRFTSTVSQIPNGVFSGCPKLSTIYVPWSQGQVANAPWGASNATIIYDYKE